MVYASIKTHVSENMEFKAENISLPPKVVLQVSPAANIEAFNVSQLRHFLEVRGLSSTGSKTALLNQCRLYASSPILRPEPASVKAVESASPGKDLEQVQWKPVHQSDKIPVPKHFDIDEICEYITYNKGIRGDEEEFVVKKPLAKGRQMYCSEKLLSVCYYREEEQSLFTKGTCEASMTSNVTYEPIVKINADGSIGNSTCTCKARSDGKCVHVAVLLLMLEDVVQGNEPKMYSPSTSKPQYWGHGSLKRKNPGALHSRTYSKKRNPNRYSQHKILVDPIEVPSQASTKRIFQGPQRESMWDRLLTYEYENYSCHPTRAQELIANVEELVNNLDHDLKRFSDDPLSNSNCVHATGTLGQANVPLWMELRRWRITGSNFKMFASNNVSTVAKSVWRKEVLPDIRALKWGRDHEPVAREAYEATSCENIYETGIFLSKKNPIFGFSPDALIGNEGLLEIKCPFSLRETKFEELSHLPNSKKSALSFTFDEHSVYLKVTHQYYYQVQLGMFVTGRHFVDFMV